LHWTERFILWELPLVRALQYEHAVLRLANIWTIPWGAPPPPPADESEFAELLALPSAEPAADTLPW
jgi:hypothetical protein